MNLDRKNMLWEGSRMFLPEHRQQLQDMRKKSQAQTLPELALDRIEEINWLLKEALHHEFPFVIDYIDHHQLTSFCGFIEQINQYEGWLLAVNGEEKRKIFFTQLYHLSR